MSERPKEHAWKACVRQKRTAGSNPALSVLFLSHSITLSLPSGYDHCIIPV